MRKTDSGKKNKEPLETDPYALHVVEKKVNRYPMSQVMFAAKYPGLYDTSSATLEKRKQCVFYSTQTVSYSWRRTENYA